MTRVRVVHLASCGNGDVRRAGSHGPRVKERTRGYRQPHLIQFAEVLCCNKERRDCRFLLAGFGVLCLSMCFTGVCSFAALRHDWSRAHSARQRRAPEK